jgi:hypothetical protein
MFHQYFLYLNKKLKFERPTDSGDEFYNAASTGVYWQICMVACVLFIYIMLPVLLCVGKYVWWLVSCLFL